ncbi:MAG: LytTR family DNA-binding domain-containing protein [Pseudomonadota bacterium]
MKIAIVEDEPLIAQRIERLTKAVRPQATTQHFSSLPEALAGLSENSADVVLLDLNLQGDDGFQLLAEAVASAAETIVISANVDRAVEAFEWGVVDFVPKPFNQARLATALDRLTAGARSSAARLTVRHRGRLEVIETERIASIHGAGDYAEIMLIDNSSRLHEKGLDALEKVLPEDFVRVHRSHILRLSTIESIRSLPGSQYRAKLRSGIEYPVSRRRVRDLRQKISSG